MRRSSLQKLREFHVEEIRPYLAARDRKPLVTQFREIAALYRRYRYPPYQYLRAGLYLQTAPDSIETFMPSKLLFSLRENLNPAEARMLAKDKLLFRQRMEAAGMPILREVLSVDPAGVIHDAEGNVLDQGAAIRMLEEEEFFAKPVAGRFGAGTRLIRPGDDVAEFLDSARGMIVQPRLRQHSRLQALYPHAVNTVRIDTLHVDDGWISNAALLKLGWGGGVVDNASHGGLAVGIDLESGRLQPVGRQKPKFSTRTYDRHPDTGVAFRDVVLPHWDLLRETVAKAAEAMLPLRSIGWDVAITEDGIVLLEANDSWGIYIFQSGWGGLGETVLGRMACELHGLKPAWRSKASRVA